MLVPLRAVPLEDMSPLRKQGRILYARCRAENALTLINRS
jgi:hypothetical protein